MGVRIEGDKKILGGLDGSGWGLEPLYIAVVVLKDHFKRTSKP